MKKRLCSVLLAIVLSVGLLPVGALAADWATDAVSTLNGIYGSDSSGPFSADDTAMTVAELNILITATGWETDKIGSDDDGDLSRSTACEVLADVFDLPLNGQSAIQYLYNKNIINGKSPDDLAANDPVTFAEFAVLTYRVLNAVGGGMGSSTDLKPGTEEYFAWMYLGARKCVKFEDAGTGDMIDEETWNDWVEQLKVLPSDNPLSGFTPPYPYTTQSVTKLTAAVDIVAEYIKAGGSSTIFSDVPAGSGYYDGVMYLFDRGIITGYGDGTFQPDTTSSRQELATILYRYEHPAWSLNPPTPAAIMEYAQNEGYLNPVDGSDTAWWDATATREEAIYAIIAACADKADVLAANTNVLGRFSDADSISTDAQQSIAYAVSIGILNGNRDGTLGLSTGVTRGQAGVLLYRTLIGLDTSKMHDYEQSVQNALGTDSDSAVAP